MTIVDTKIDHTVCFCMVVYILYMCVYMHLYMRIQCILYYVCDMKAHTINKQLHIADCMAHMHSSPHLHHLHQHTPVHLIPRKAPLVQQVGRICCIQDNLLPQTLTRQSF